MSMHPEEWYCEADVPHAGQCGNKAVTKRYTLDKELIRVCDFHCREEFVQRAARVDLMSVTIKKAKELEGVDPGAIIHVQCTHQYVQLADGSYTRSEQPVDGLFRVKSVGDAYLELEIA